MAAGRLWEPQEPGAKLPQMLVKGTPSWVERGLNMIDNGDSQILIIDQQSNHSSGGDGSDYKGTADSHSERNTTYLLGQNVPIEPTLKAERESRRIKALELQAAIMQQLEDRERQKKQEKERRLKEEREEEDRFRRQRDLERQRLDEERKLIEEKRQREHKRAEALRVALEKAEQQAKLEKENKKNKKMQNDFDALSLNSEMDIKVHREIVLSPRANSLQPGTDNESKLIQNIYIEQTYSPRKMVSEESNKAYNYANANETNSIISHSQTHYPRQIDQQNNEMQLNESKNKEAPKLLQETVGTLFPGHPPMNMLAEAPLSLVQIPLPHELFTPVHFAHGSGMQMAFLMPQHMNSIYPCIHQPMNMQNHYNDSLIQQQKNLYQMQSQTDTDESCSNRESKVLTPSIYRNPNSRDVCTQTDFGATNITQKNVEPITENEARRVKSNDFYDQNYEPNTSEEKLNTLVAKKEKRFQPEERYTKELESRPKWGVNKPPTQYKKQSEKDIFYAQKRKLRQRKRIQEKNYTSHSSDDNRSPSPPHELFKQLPKNNDKDRLTFSENHWRKKSLRSDKPIHSGNLIVETTQISPLECDKSGVVHISDNLGYQQQKKYQEKILPKRGITLSQKFMNDKYGNPKLWRADSNSGSTFPETKHYPNNHTENDTSFKVKDKFEDRKLYFDNLNKAKKEQSSYYCESDVNQPVILDQLRSLRDSLKNQQKIWGKHKGKRSPSPKLEVDMEME